MAATGREQGSENDKNALLGITGRSLGDTADAGPFRGFYSLDS